MSLILDSQLMTAPKSTEPLFSISILTQARTPNFGASAAIGFGNLFPANNSLVDSLYNTTDSTYTDSALLLYRSTYSFATPLNKLVDTATQVKLTISNKTFEFEFLNDVPSLHLRVFKTAQGVQLPLGDVEYVRVGPITIDKII